MSEPRPLPAAASGFQVFGLDLDDETRCFHYRSPLDIVAIKMKCCGVYYACKDCHTALTGHEIERWPEEQFSEKAILCGHCRTELTIREYLASGHRCPACGAAMNPRCANHYRFYFEIAAPDSGRTSL